MVLQGSFSADFPSVALLAQHLGVPKITAYQWERGSAATSPAHRPPAQLMPRIADALKVSLQDLLWALWREKDEDPCPCGCGGKTSFLDTGPEARTLAIAIPCAKCGLKRIRKRSKKDRHRKLCPICAKSVERIEFTCLGYKDHNATRHSQTCPGTMLLRPSEVNARQRLKDNGLKSLFDVPSKTYQCNSCAGAGKLIAEKERELRVLLAKQNPHLKIRSGQQRIKLLRDHHAELSPHFKPNPEAQKLGRRNFAQRGAEGKTWPKMTKANLIKRWFRPDLPEAYPIRNLYRL